MKKRGIDISRWNAGLSFASVKKQGYEFIIPRDGWGTDLDPQLQTFISEAKAQGIEIPAVYHFIYAVSTEEVIRNAQAAIDNVEKVGLPKSTIIWCDLEYDTVDKAKAKGVILTEKMQKEFVETFCNYILAQGYPTGVYVNQDYMLRVFGKDFGKDYDLWLSDLEGEPAYQCVYRQTGYGNVNGISVDENSYYGQYTAGTAKPRKEETMGKPKSKEYLREAFGVLDRPEGLEYINKPPYNCGYCHQDKHLSGDCWNIHPKSTIWSLFFKDPISKNYTPGKAYYDAGGKVSGLPDTVGDEIMSRFCTKTTFKKMVRSPKAPCMLLIDGSHMGAYLGEYKRDGKTYNVSEFSPNYFLGGKMRSYVDEYGRRLPYKEWTGDPIGTWNKCGYLTAFLDYSDWDETPAPTPEPTPAPTPAPTPLISYTDLAIEIMRGKWGNNPTRETDITNKYGAAKYKAAQKRVDTIMSALNWYRIEVQLAAEILDDVWGNNPVRQQKITMKYGANAYRIAQLFVNDIAGELHLYTIDELKTAYDVANNMIYGVYGDGAERKAIVIKKFGEKIRDLAQEIVDDILK